MTAVTRQSGTILVVETDSALRTVLLELLSSEGYHALAAPDNRRAFAMAEQHRPDVIVLDVGARPAVDWELVSRLRRGDSTSRIPVIALSGPPIGRAGAGSVEPDGLIRKPFDVSVLLEHLDRLVGRA